MEITLDIFETDEFVRCFRATLYDIEQKIPTDRKANPYDRMCDAGLLFHTWPPLDDTKTYPHQRAVCKSFVAEYCRCIEKKSALPAAKRQWLLCIGDSALKRTINILETKEKDHGKKQTDNVGRAV